MSPCWSIRSSITERTVQGISRVFGTSKMCQHGSNADTSGYHIDLLQIGQDISRVFGTSIMCQVRKHVKRSHNEVSDRPVKSIVWIVDHVPNEEVCEKKPQ